MVNQRHINLEILWSVEVVPLSLLLDGNHHQTTILNRVYIWTNQ